MAKIRISVYRQNYTFIKLKLSITVKKNRRFLKSKIDR